VSHVDSALNRGQVSVLYRRPLSLYTFLAENDAADESKPSVGPRVAVVEAVKRAIHL